MKAIKAWAVINSADSINDFLFVDEGHELLVYRKKEQALKRRIKDVGDKIIPVLITPLKPK